MPRQAAGRRCLSRGVWAGRQRGGPSRGEHAVRRAPLLSRRAAGRCRAGDGAGAGRSGGRGKCGSGGTPCQARSRPAFGYFQSGAVGNSTPPGAGGKVFLVLGANRFEMPAEIGLGDGRWHRDPVLVALAPADGELVGDEVGVLDSQAAAFGDARAGPVEQIMSRVT